MTDFLSDLIVDFFAAGGAALIRGQRDASELLPQVRQLLPVDTRRGFVIVACHDPQLQLLAQLVCMERCIPYVPVNPTWPAKRIDRIVALSGAATMLDQDPSSADGAPRITELAGQPPTSTPSGDEDPLYVMFTSGSTGNPKGVLIGRRAYISFLMWMNDVFADVDSRARMIAIAEFTFDLSHMNIALLLLKRATFRFSEAGGNVPALLTELERERATVLVAVPTLLNLVFAARLHQRFDLSALSHVVVGGAAFPVPLYEGIRDMFSGSRVFNFYGPTEATVFCTVREITGDTPFELRRGVVSVGRPLPNCTICVADPADHSRVLPVGEVGDVLIGGTQLLTRYVNPDISESEYISRIDGDRWYRSGDLGFLDEAGNVFIAGRSDDTVKTGGYRVNTSEVEGAVRLVPSVRDAAVIAVPHHLRENVLVAFVVSDDDTDNPERIRRHLAEHLTHYQMPAKVVLVDRLPLSENGKVARDALMRMTAQAS